MGGTETNSDDTERLLNKVEAGDPDAFERLLARHRDELRRAVELRLDPRLRSRFDASDVVQEVQVEAFRRIDEFLERRPMPFGLWLYKTAYQRLGQLRRRHIGAQRRTVRREVAFSEHSSLVIARLLVKDQSTLLAHLSRREREAIVATAIAGLDEGSREVLLMRHVEGLAHPQIAEVLEISHAAVRQRYGRALIKLQRALARHGLHDSE